jgi:hypothetical protein
VFCDFSLVVLVALVALEFSLLMSLGFCVYPLREGTSGITISME